MQTDICKVCLTLCMQHTSQLEQLGIPLLKQPVTEAGSLLTNQCSTSLNGWYQMLRREQALTWPISVAV